jgi:hypothetical protein
MILNRRLATVRCLACGAVLISQHLHDCRVCRCFQQTTVTGGSAYLRFDGNDLGLVDVLVDPGWPRAAHLGRLQQALRLARRLGCWLNPRNDATDADVAKAVAWLQRAVSAAEMMPEDVLVVRIAQGDWPVPTSEPVPDMVREMTRNKSGC